jgi:hypothetical protein
MRLGLTVPSPDAALGDGDSSARCLCPIYLSKVKSQFGPGIFQAIQCTDCTFVVFDMQIGVRIINVRRMRTFATIFGLALLAFVSLTKAQPAAINQITQAQAVKLVSHLALGMREEDATTFLKLGGLKSGSMFGDSFGWVHSFRLADKKLLCLDIKPKNISPDGAWENGLLQAAFISSNGISILSISLTNAP